eukprot:1034675-Rhodomonas_salina.1
MELSEGLSSANFCRKPGANNDLGRWQFHMRTALSPSNIERLSISMPDSAIKPHVSQVPIRISRCNRSTMSGADIAFRASLGSWG